MKKAIKAILTVGLISGVVALVVYAYKKAVDTLNAELDIDDEDFIDNEIEGEDFDKDYTEIYSTK